MRLGLAVIVLCLTWGGWAWAGERLQVPELAGWKVVAGVRDGNGESTELIPAQENAEDWTRRVTIQAFRNNRLGVAEFLDRAMQNSASVCDSTAAGPSSLGRVSGFDAGSRTVSCGRYRGDGRGHFTLYFVVRGQSAFYVVSRSWRGAAYHPTILPIGQDELADWTRFANAIELCVAADVNKGCK